MYENEKKAIAIVSKLVEERAAKAIRERGFMRNLFVQLDKLYGLYLTGDIEESKEIRREKQIDSLMKSIVNHKQISFGDLEKEFLLTISRADLDNLLGLFLKAEFISITEDKENL